MSHRQLFGADDEAEGQELDDAEKNGENGKSRSSLGHFYVALRSAPVAEEIQELRKEAQANKALRASLREEGAAKRVFTKVNCTSSTCSSEHMR